MAPPSRPVYQAEYDRKLAQIIAQRAVLAEDDRKMVQNTQQAIQRSRELLEATKHLVIPPSQRE